MVGFRVTELSNFWREMSESSKDDPKSQADINPDFLKRVKREVNEKAVEDKKGQGFFNELEGQVN